jgi:hypothetical protein
VFQPPTVRVKARGAAPRQADRDHDARRRATADACVICGMQAGVLRNNRCENCQGLSLHDQR